MDLIGVLYFLLSECSECSLTYLGIGRRIFVVRVGMGRLLKDDFFSTAKKPQKWDFLKLSMLSDIDNFNLSTFSEIISIFLSIFVSNQKSKKRDGQINRKRARNRRTESLLHI